MRKRDGPYLILTQKSPTAYVIASLANPSERLCYLPYFCFNTCQRHKHFSGSSTRKEADHEKLHPHHKINMFQARRLLQQQFSNRTLFIPQQELLLQQLIMFPRRDVVGSIRRPR
ncbi:hypothetical protein TNCV_3408081 [Trichonephila clavipes]|nr:hypothetical protein TNCV_3408081 [Trichonephila clavipes]